ncbi:MAG: ABC transporter permease [Chloroflexi bacterium]|nr:ABC transporter permease [Chloroflexota bacterium]
MARAYEHQLLLYRRTWRGSIFNSFFSPTMFLLAMGVGLGTYVDRSGGAATAGVPYLAFIAPGLLAATVMQTASFESTFPVIAGFVWVKRYHAMYASPIGPREIALAQLAWSATRVTVVGAIFVLVTLAFGAVRSPLIVLAIPVATLTGLAFATPIAAFAATQRTMNKFSYLFRFAITPLFLFSGTFFPVEQLPAVIQPIAWLTPLYHGVALCRALALGTVGSDPTGAAIHLAVLLAVSIGGLLAALVTFQRRLAT